ncbi:cystathionine beta-lyase [Paenalcaligenes sp. Me52]|uniref:cystathionine beta-lyase n=1 Tax=Paenalcaligenes sp. Me52 TaxID=3392038 RepID=UPI003D2853E2
MSQSSYRHLDTLLAHLGLAEFDPQTGAAPVAIPSVRSSTVRFRSLEDLDNAQAAQAAGQRRPAYGRGGLDTHAALEQVFCELEQGQYCVLVPSGMASIALSLTALAQHGDHVLVTDSAYAPVRLYDSGLAKRLGIEITYVKPDEASVRAAIRPNTKVLYLESPGSLLMQMLDVPALVAVAKEHNLVTVADNTWGSGYAYRPLELGVDVSVIAATKYVAGHSDLMMGAVVVGDNPALISAVKKTNYALGYSVSADDVWLALRGVRTLSVRMRESASNGLKLAEFLSTLPEVERVFHPALPSDPGHALWKRDATGSNGMLAFSLNLQPEQARRFVNALTLFGIGYSWGGFESLVQYVEPELVTPHSYWNRNTKPLIRLHAGLENAQDLIADLTQALAAAKAA